MNPKSGMFRQRVGALIEQHICDKYNLFYNKRQRKMGYFDAYSSDTIYEIKSTIQGSNTFVIIKKNHDCCF